MYPSGPPYSQGSPASSLIPDYRHCLSILPKTTENIIKICPTSTSTHQLTLEHRPRHRFDKPCPPPRFPHHLREPAPSDVDYPTPSPFIPGIKTASSREHDSDKMAVDALNNLVNNIPDWQRRLEDLSGQIDRRQAELATLNAEQPLKATAARSLRNKGSAESLKPKDDGPLHMDVDSTQPPNRPDPGPGLGNTHVSGEQVLPSSPESANRLALHRKAREAVVAAHSRALAHAKNKRRPSSMVSAEGAPATYRTRSLIIVYYDSYVQAFFDELVRFISSGRNLLRKARMAAKVAQIKRMAELEMPDDDTASGDDRVATDSLPSLRYMSTRRLGPMYTTRRADLGGYNGDDEPLDVYESLDKSLEFVQSTCEHGAHQFLRDADCDEEIRKIQARMTEVLATAEKEMKRVLREDPELAMEPGDLEKARARRPISIIRRDVRKGGFESEKESQTASESPRPDRTKATTVIEAANPLEVDSKEDTDEGIGVMLPNLQYRSTRYMRSRAG